VLTFILNKAVVLRLYLWLSWYYSYYLTDPTKIVITALGLKADAITVKPEYYRRASHVVVGNATELKLLGVPSYQPGTNTVRRYNC
jgi:hypothetical protein